MQRIGIAVSYLMISIVLLPAECIQKHLQCKIPQEKRQDYRWAKDKEMLPEKMEEADRRGEMIPQT